MTDDFQFTVTPRVRELGSLVREGTAEWRKEPVEAEQKFLQAANLREKLAQTAYELIDSEDLDLQKVDRILAETLNNFAVINLDNNRPERALELATRALELLLKLQQYDQTFLDTLDLLKEIHTRLNLDDVGLLRADSAADNDSELIDMSVPAKEFEPSATFLPARTASTKQKEPAGKKESSKKKETGSKKEKESAVGEKPKKKKR